MGSFVSFFRTKCTYHTNGNGTHPVESSHHCWLDLYAVIAFLPTEDTLKTILQALKEANMRWDLLSQLGYIKPVRPDFHPPQNVPWQILILHPDAICPEQSPIAILSNPALARVINPVWTLLFPVNFILSNAAGRPRVFFHGDPGTGQSSIPVLPTMRTNSESVSVMAAIINANSKLQYAMSHGYSCTMDQNIINQADLCKKIVQEFFKRPLPDDDELSDMDEDDPTPRPGDEHEVEDYGDDMDYEEAAACEQSDEKDLTPKEYGVLSVRARNPKLSIEERTNAAMMMLFGPQRMCFSLLKHKGIIDRILSIYICGGGIACMTWSDGLCPSYVLYPLLEKQMHIEFPRTHIVKCTPFLGSYMIIFFSVCIFVVS